MTAPTLTNGGYPSHQRAATTGDNKLLRPEQNFVVRSKTTTLDPSTNNRYLSSSLSTTSNPTKDDRVIEENQDGFTSA